jgi:cell division septation protein DedD
MSADPFHPLASGDTALFYRAAVGVHGQDYHLPRFLRFDEAGQTSLSWNWAASLFTLNWLVYRKMWSWALAYVGVLATAGLLVFGLGKLVFDYSGALTWMLGLWLVSAAYIVPGLYANVWLYGHYNDRISDVLRQSSGVVDTIGRLTAVAPGPRRLGRQVLANVLVLVVLLMPVLATQDWQGLGERAWSQLASLVPRDVPKQEASAPQPSPQSSAPATQTASGRVDGAGAAAPAPATASGVLTQAVAATLPSVPAPAPPSARPVDDASTRPVVAFEPAFDGTARSGRPGADVVPVTSFAANPVAAAPLNVPLPAPFSAPGATSASARGSAAPSADLVPLQPVTLPSSRLQAPQAPQPATAPRRLQLAQADTAATPLGNRAGNGTSGVVTRSPAAAPTASAAPAPADGEKPQASARLRAASQAAQAKRATQSQGGTVTASAAPQSGVGAMPLSAPPLAAALSPSPRPAGSPAWVVQAGVFRQADNAHRMVAQLQAMGIEAALENLPNSRGEPLLRVVAGPYAQQAQAQQAAQRIKARSLPAMVMREAR